MTNPVLYILMRTDLASLNSGKMAAQACHAANQCVKQIREAEEYEILNTMVDEWECSTGEGFGTTIVLDGGTITDIRQLVECITFKQATMACASATFNSDMIYDPSYPLIDGQTLHVIPLETCAYVFADKDDEQLRIILDKFPLHA